MKNCLIFLLLFVACNSKVEEKNQNQINTTIKTNLVFDIPKLIVSSKEEIFAELGKSQYSQTSNVFETKILTGPIFINDKTEIFTFIKNNYRLEFYFIPNKLSHPIEIFFCTDKNIEFDSLAKQNLKVAGNLLDSSFLPKNSFHSFNSRGFKIINLNK